MEEVVWIGLASTNEVFEQLSAKGYFHGAAHTAQRNLIMGIEKYIGGSIDTINAFMMPSFPSCPEIYTPAMQWSHKSDSEDVAVASVNIRYVDFLARKFFLKRAAREWSRNHASNEKITVFIYPASEPYIEAALEIKRNLPKAKTVLIIPDIPQYMEMNASRLKRFLKNSRWNKLKSLIKQCDYYVLFTKHMVDYLHLKKKNWMVMEGSVNIYDIKYVEHPQEDEDKNNKIIIMYSGAIGLKYGIPELLDAFRLIDDPDYELWFTGQGDADSLVHDAEKRDSRIHHYGFFANRNDVLVLQKKASMLITTRMPTEKASSYCFPSKIFEYLLSGKPVLSFRIEGIPDEYYKYLVEMKSTSPKDMANSIKRIGNMSDHERKQIGEQGRRFVIDEKNCYRQGGRICEFVGLEMGGD